LHQYQQNALATFSAASTDRADAALGLLLALEALLDGESLNDGRRNRHLVPLAETALETAVRSLREKRVLTGLADSAFSLAMAPDGNRVFAGASDGVVLTWDLATGRKLGQLRLGDNNIGSISVSSDGARVITGSGSALDQENVARLWDTETGKEIRSFPIQSVWNASPFRQKDHSLSQAPRIILQGSGIPRLVSCCINLRTMLASSPALQ
jgi:WD40 repeat protein